MNNEKSVADGPAEGIATETFRSDRELLQDILFYARTRLPHHEKFTAALSEASMKINGFRPVEPAAPVVLNCGCKGEMHDANCACTCTDSSKDPWCRRHSLSVHPAAPVVHADCSCKGRTTSENRSHEITCAVRKPIDESNPVAWLYQSWVDIGGPRDHWTLSPIRATADLESTKAHPSGNGEWPLHNVRPLYLHPASQPAPVVVPDEEVPTDNFWEASKFAGITFSQGCQFHLMLQHLLGKGPAPGFLKTELAALPSDQKETK